MVNHNLRMYQEMLVVVFGVPFQIVKGFKTNEKFVPRNFMTMKLWEDLTEQQFDALYNILHADGVANNESFELFVNSAVVMNEDLHRGNGRKEVRTLLEEPLKMKRIESIVKRIKMIGLMKDGREYYLKNKDKIRKKIESI